MLFALFYSYFGGRMHCEHSLKKAAKEPETCTDSFLVTLQA